MIVCESLIDALTSGATDYGTSRAFGADGFTDELHKALTEAGVQRVLIAFDRDDAGDRGAAALADRLGAEGVECFRVVFPAGQDANSFATQVEEPAGALAQLLREAVWIARASRPRARRLLSPSRRRSSAARAALRHRARAGDPSSAAKAAAPSSSPPSSPVPRPPALRRW